MLDINSTLGWNTKTPQRSSVKINNISTILGGIFSMKGDLVRITGNEISYNKSVTTGDTFTVNSDGVYSLDFNMALGAGGYFGISVNADITATITSLPEANVICYQYVSNADIPAPIGATVPLKRGDVIRLQGVSIGSSGGNATLRTFIMTKVSD